MSKIRYTSFYLKFLLFFFFPALLTSQPEALWRVWVKITPCSGRSDWISVSKDDPTFFGLGSYELASRVVSPLNCTVTGCSFDDATAVANEVRKSDIFFNYCCRDYSVWEKMKTGERSVVLGKYSTAGYGWNLIKSNLCCEEAEDLADLPGACSTSSESEYGISCSQYPGSIVVWNDITKQMECDCPDGMVWNVKKTACIEVKNSDCSAYPGSYAAFNEKTMRVECFCPEGKVWNATQTACIEDVSKISCYPGSYAALNPNTNKVECYCNVGLVWNTNRTACVKPDDLVRNTDCSRYKDSYPGWNDQTQRVECFCPDCKVWNAQRTACIDDVSKVNCWPGSHAVWNEQMQRSECYCNEGLVWNNTQTACIESDNKNKISNGDKMNAGKDIWILVSSTTIPEKKTGWNYNSQSSSAHYDVYNGDKIDFNWTPPPSQISISGFTINISVTSTLGPYSRVMSSLIGVSASGCDSDTPSGERMARSEIPGNPSSSKVIKYTPTSSSSLIDVEVGLLWGEVKFIYKYQKK